MIYGIIGFAVLMVAASVDWTPIIAAVKEWFNRK